MFCFQCQEAAGGKGCTIKGVCGKQPQTSGLMDVLLYAVRGEAIVNRLLREKGAADIDASRQILDALFCTIPNANLHQIPATTDPIQKAVLGSITPEEAIKQVKEHLHSLMQQL